MGEQRLLQVLDWHQPITGSCTGTLVWELQSTSSIASTEKKIHGFNRSTRTKKKRTLEQATSPKKAQASSPTGWLVDQLRHHPLQLRDVAVAIDEVGREIS